MGVAAGRWNSQWTTVAALPLAERNRPSSIRMANTSSLITSHLGTAAGSLSTSKTLLARSAAPDTSVAAALETAQARNAELGDVNTVVAQRLDGAITRIKTILED